MKLPFQFASLVLCILLAACGGGGGGDPPAGASTVISGTVAAGAPVIGNVFVKDSTGAVRGPVAIEANGSYRIDVSGMTSPFLFRAEGSVGGREVVLASAATAADVGGTINVTPFTDLIVANVAGTVASRFYDSPNFARLTPAELDAARQTLTARLLPVLRELGVQDGFDLLRSAFTANHQGFDAVMDVLRVSVDQATNTALITDLVNGQQITDDLASRADAAVLPAPVPGSLTGAARDLAQVGATLDVLTRLFASSVPAASNATLLGVLAPDLLNDGANLSQFLTDEFLLDPALVGLRFGSPVLLSRNGDAELEVRFLIHANGAPEPAEMVFRRDAGGTWRLAGNQRLASANLDAINHRHLPPVGAMFYSRFLELWVDSLSTQVQAAVFTGPGVRGGRFVRSTSTNSDFTLVNAAGAELNTSWVPECASAASTACVDFSQVGTAAQAYTVTYYNAAGQEVGVPQRLTLAAVPLDAAAVQAVAAQRFASFGSLSPAGRTGLVNGTNLTVGWTAGSDAAYRVTSVTMISPQVRFDVDPGTGRSGSTLLGTWSGATPNSAGLSLWSGTGAGGHSYVTTRPYP